MTGEPGDARAAGGFEVHLDVFEGPFDLLLALISKHKLDITEIALSSVTDEFIGYIRALADGWDLDQASYFLVVAATLLDLKAARLLPAGEVDDEEDLALLEARDLLFARLLQYRAYKEVAAVLASRMAAAGRQVPAAGADGVRASSTCCPRCCSASARPSSPRSRPAPWRPRRPPVVSTAHLHMPLTSVREQVGLLAGRLARLRRATFRQLAARLRRDLRDRRALPRGTRAVPAAAGSRSTRLAPLGDLYVSWTAGGQPGERTSTQKADE